MGEKSSHGGRREGAGRRPGPARKDASIRVARELRDLIRSDIRQEGGTIADYLDTAVRWYWSRHSGTVHPEVMAKSAIGRDKREAR